MAQTWRSTVRQRSAMEQVQYQLVILASESCLCSIYEELWKYDISKQSISCNCHWLCCISKTDNSQITKPMKPWIENTIRKPLAAIKQWTKQKEIANVFEACSVAARLINFRYIAWKLNSLRCLKNEFSQVDSLFQTRILYIYNFKITLYRKNCFSQGIYIVHKIY